MLVKTACPRCQQSYKVPRERQGHTLKCQKCGETFTLCVSVDETRSPPSPPLGHAGSPDRLHAGMRLAGFEIRHKLGAGAMGEVWLAHDVTLERPVAIKVLPVEFSRDEVRLARFLREAKSAARLDHPNTATVYQAGVENGIAFIAMQYIDGGSLEDTVQPGQPMPWREATKVICDAAQGLAAAHQMGLVHRDVKPSNLMRTSGGVTKVVDFGLARGLESDSHMTQHGAILGTPAYMAPELWMNQAADPRSDVYALACTYYYLLTGQPPFDGTNLPALGYQHRYEPFPDARALTPDLPDAVCRILTRGAAKELSQRYATAAEFAGDLEIFLAGPKPSSASGSLPSSAAPAPLNPCARFPYWAWPAAGVGILLVSLVVFLNLRSRPTRNALSEVSANVQVPIDGDEIQGDGRDNSVNVPVGEHDLVVSPQEQPTSQTDDALPLRPPSPASPPKTMPQRIEEALVSPTVLAFIETPLTDIVDYLKARHEIEIQIDRAALMEAKIESKAPVTRSAKDITLQSALNLMLRDLGLTHAVVDEVLLITTPQALARIHGAAAPPPPTPADPVPAKASTPSLADKLKQPCTITFAKDTLERHVARLSEETGIPMVVMASDLQWESAARFDLSERGKSISDVLISILKKSSRTLVYVIKDQNGLETVFITTRKAAIKRGDPIPPECPTDPGLLVNSIGMELAWIQAGGFQMGTTAEQAVVLLRGGIPGGKSSFQDEQPPHKVQITKPFHMGIHEVTHADFARFVQDQNFKTEPEQDGRGGTGDKYGGRPVPEYDWRDIGFPQEDSHPVVNVTWNDAVAFCKWLSTKEKQDYRLPTEAEWEYACRDGTTNQNGINSRSGFGNVAESSTVRAEVVGKQYSNLLGLFDVDGNVSEWCFDRYDKEYYKLAPALDPPGPGFGSRRVIRGGSWRDSAWGCRSANRDSREPSDRSHYLGFRVVLTATGHNRPVNPPANPTRRAPTNGPSAQGGGGSGFF